jgi:hypothetical protein
MPRLDSALSHGPSQYLADGPVTGTHCRVPGVLARSPSRTEPERRPASPWAGRRSRYHDAVMCQCVPGPVSIAVLPGTRSDGVRRSRQFTVTACRPGRAAARPGVRPACARIVPTTRMLPWSALAPSGCWAPRAGGRPGAGRAAPSAGPTESARGQTKALVASALSRRPPVRSGRADGRRCPVRRGCVASESRHYVPPWP